MLIHFIETYFLRLDEKRQKMTARQWVCVFFPLAWFSSRCFFNDLSVYFSVFWTMKRKIAQAGVCFLFCGFVCLTVMTMDFSHNALAGTKTSADRVGKPRQNMAKVKIPPMNKRTAKEFIQFSKRCALKKRAPGFRLANNKDKNSDRKRLIHPLFEVQTRKQAKKLSPHADALPGSWQTLSKMDARERSEFMMTYKLSNATRAQLLLNEQNDISPVYTPLDESSRIASAGVRLGVELETNTQLFMGAEYQKLPAASHDELEADSASGANLGICFSF